MKKKGIPVFWLKAIVSGALVFWLFRSLVDIRPLLNVLAGADIKLVGLAFSLRFVGVYISSARWKKLLDTQEIRIRLFTLYDSYLVASFFNLFMPTRIGGDVVRISDLRRVSKSLSKSASTIFAERFFGILVLLVSTLAASLIQVRLAKELPPVWIGIGLGLTGLGVLLLVLYTRILEFCLRLLPFAVIRNKMLPSWQTFRQSALFLLLKKESSKWGLWYSLLLQVNVVLHFWLLGKSLGFNISLVNYFILVPIQLFVLMLPSINGIGLREVSSILLFGWYGVRATEAVAFGMLDLVTMMIFGLVGWFRFLTRASISAVETGEAKSTCPSRVLKTES